VTIHAGLIARRVGGLWRGVLIEGASGAGKSDLALRALSQGFRLVADDRVVLWTSGGRLWGRAPDALSGLLEARGLGIEAASPIPFCEVALVARPGAPERLPDAETVEVSGLSLPLIVLDYLHASAPAKLGRALDRFDVGGNRRI
jgi:serine kinase of HPr protein (carbohydrate metabolism regulator)